MNKYLKYLISGISAIAAGNWHSLAVKSDGTVWAWGNNSAGQLGTGTNAFSLSPVQTSNLTDVVSIACGRWYSMALKSNGEIFNWGSIGGNDVYLPEPVFK